MVIILSKGSFSLYSNLSIPVGSFPMDFKEEEIVDQLQEDIEVDKQESHTSNHPQDDATSKYVFS